MEKKYFLNLLILCATLVQGISSLSKGNVEESLDLHNRKKRFTNPEDSRQVPVQLSLVPYVVNILRNNYSVCAGTILKFDVVITSVSCMMEPGRYSIFSNSEQRDGGTPHSIKVAFPHKDYDHRTLDYDIALLRIDPPIEPRTSRNRPIELYDEGPTAVNVFGRVSGDNIVYPQELRSVRMRIITNHLCKSLLRRNLNVTNNRVCTFDDRRIMHACDGDGGSPLVVNGKLLGVLSFPPGSDNRDEPELYTNVADPTTREWIRAAIIYVQEIRC